jgi:hypothetical protein
MAADSYLADGVCGAELPPDRVNTAQVLPLPSSSAIFQHIPMPKKRPLQNDETKSLLILKVKTPFSKQPESKQAKPSPTMGFLERIMAVANRHAHGSNREIFLLLVTSSYIEIFMNFVCHVKALSDMPNTGMFLVLTPHQDVLKVAKGAGFGGVFLDFNDPYLSSVFAFHNMNELQKKTGADFGTISYQRMIYVRTYVALVLLQGDFNSVIVDIDTVWFKYPLGLPLLTQEGREVTDIDVIVTFDQDEICGCFVYLNATKEAILFWTAVVEKHHTLLEDNHENNRNYSGHMSNFFDSEQKILTGFLLHGKYQTPDNDHNLKVYTHPRLWFLNGNDYFLSDFDLMNKNFATNGLPAVIHNNFIIGNAMKKNRFQRFGLWRVDTWELFHSKESTLHADYNRSEWVTEYLKNHDSILSSLYCVPAMTSSLSSKISAPFFGTSSATSGEATVVTGGVLRRWTEYGTFHEVSRNTALRSLNIVLPLHNEMDHGSEYLKAMVMAEGIGSVKGRIFMNRNPPAYFEFDNSFFVAELSYDFPFTSFTVDFKSAGFVSYVDVVGGNNVEKSVSIDRSYKYHRRADDRVRNSKLWVKEWDLQQTAAAAQNYVSDNIQSDIDDNPSNHMTKKSSKSEDTATSSVLVHKTSKQFSFQLRVLTYNRPTSLQRLLTSLANADYGIDNDVSLCILVDFPGKGATAEDVSTDSCVVLVPNTLFYLSKLCIMFVFACSF